MISVQVRAARRRAAPIIREVTLAKKSLGQHFLSDPLIAARIAQAVSDCGLETVVEVGPGKGALTVELAPLCSNLVAIELDTLLAQRMAQRYKSSRKVMVLEDDARTADVASLPLLSEDAYTLTGNLPYNAALPIIRNFLESRFPPAFVVCMLQLEVAQALSAPPGNRSFAAVLMQSYAELELLFRVPPIAFRPRPNVESAVLRMALRPRHAVAPGERAAFFRFVYNVFRTPRKQLVNALMNGLRLERQRAERIVSAAAVDPSARPGNLTLEEWQAVHGAWRASGEAGGDAP